MEDVATNVSDTDTTGGMAKKIEEAAAVAAGGVDVIIAQVCVHSSGGALGGGRRGGEGVALHSSSALQLAGGSTDTVRHGWQRRG